MNVLGVAVVGVDRVRHAAIRVALLALVAASSFLDVAFAIADDRGRFPIDVIEVHDGDTILARILLPWKISLGPEQIRAVNYDAWEISRARRTVEITDGEIAKGKAAREFVATIAKERKLYVTPQAGGKRDVYGRVLAEFWFRGDGGEWVDLGKLMTEKGHVRK